MFGQFKSDNNRYKTTFLSLEIESMERYNAKASRFFEDYILTDMVVDLPGGRIIRKLKRPEERTCIFCSRDSSSTTFISEAHMFPQLMGNKKILSDFECHQCNQLFSKNENDLANYLGISRTFSIRTGDKRPPGFATKTMSAKTRAFLGNNIIVVDPEDLQVFDGNCTFSYTKNSYVPSKVYKALIKSALSILGEQVIKGKYRHLISYMKGHAHIDSGAIIYEYQFPFETKYPFVVYLFEPKAKRESLYDHIVGISFQNKMMYIPLPGLNTIACRNMEVLPPPPIKPIVLSAAWYQSTYKVVDLSSSNVKSDDVEVISFSFDLSNLPGGLQYYDPNTESYGIGSLDAAKKGKIIITNDSFQCTPKELSAFMREQFPPEFESGD